MKKKIRIAVAIVPTGEWASCGGSWIKSDTEAIGYAVEGLPEGETTYIVEADIEIPTDVAPIVQGTATLITPSN